MKFNDIEKLQRRITDKLAENNIFAFSVIITEAIDPMGFCCINLYNQYELDDLLNFIDYEHLCDKSGVIVIKESNTVILRGIIALQQLYGKL